MTCSLEPEENERLVEAFLAARPEFAREPLAPLLPPVHARFANEAGVWRLPPGGGHDGFTVQVLRRG
ncbi:MAG TPA: hypothetical protein PK570_08030 [Thermoanaerobaculia bacterium]|nr:hypothetical protein [Thermoanaerobaculia bacterium]